MGSEQCHVSLWRFQNLKITFQKLTKQGLQNITSTVIEMAEAEGLQAHANAVKVRMKPSTSKDE